MGNQVSIEFDGDEAQRAIDTWRQVVGDGAEDAVRQLAVLSERYMKEEAPEGVGIPEVNMQNTISAEQVSDDPFGMVVKPRKSTDNGIPLHHIIIEGTDSGSYSARPPVEPLMSWAAAKLGDESAAWAIREKIFQEGHSTLPNEFVDRSVQRWKSRTDDIAQDAVDEAFGGGI